MTSANLSLYVAFAILVGTLMPVQGAVNSQLAKLLSNPFQSAFISFFIGAIICLIPALIVGNPISLTSLRSAPIWYFAGGLLGTSFVLTSIFLIGKVGATVLLGSFVTGQLIMSLIIDNYGLIGVPQNPVSLARVSGVVFLIIGLGLIVKK